jgi:hypothetical protein
MSVRGDTDFIWLPIALFSCSLCDVVLGYGEWCLRVHGWGRVKCEFSRLV